MGIVYTVCAATYCALMFTPWVTGSNWGLIEANADDLHDNFEGQRTCQGLYRDVCMGKILLLIYQPYLFQSLCVPVICLHLTKMYQYFTS